MTTKTDITRTYYLTKYALGGGIKAVPGKPSMIDPRYIDLDGYGAYYLLGSGVFETEAEAIANAEARRIKKIASLKKQIAKLEKMKFEGKS